MENGIILNYEFNKIQFPVTEEAQIGYLFLEAKPGNGTTPDQAPLNLCLVMDRSASMKGPKIENVKQAIGNIIDTMTADDYLALVTFNEEAEVLVPAQQVTDKDSLKNMVNQLTYSGGTTISTGMREGLNEIRKNFSDDRVNRMIMLTDGQTYGDEDACFQLAAGAHDDNIGITALGVGDEWHEELLDTIAEKNNGKSDYIATPGDIIPIFAGEMKNLQSTVAQNTRVQLRFVNGIKPRKACRVIPYISELEFESYSENEMTVNLGNLDSDTGQGLLVEMIIDPKRAGKFRISQAELVYDVPAQEQLQQKLRQDVIAEFSTDPDARKKVNPKVMNIVERVSAYDLQTRALNQAAAGDVAGATRRLRAAATRLLDIGEEELAQAAMTEATNLEKQGAMTAAGTKKLRYETRKLTQRLF